MDAGSQSNSNSSNAPPPFLTKTYDMADDPLTNSVVSWSHSGCSFVVWNPPEFAQDLLPKYFKHNNFSSFVRQLNTYGFRKIDPDQWEFGNEEFIRGQRHLLKNIHRRKPVHSHSTQNLNLGNISPLTEQQKQEYENEIIRLKHDKDLLELELQRQEAEKQEFEFQIVSLGERMRSMEYRQKQLISFLAHELIHKPEFASCLMLQSQEYHNKKRKLPNLDPSFQFQGKYNEENLTCPIDNIGPTLLHADSIEKLNSSLKFLEHLLYAFGERFGEEVHDLGVKSQPSVVIVRELSPSTADGEPWSPPHSRDIPSSPTCVHNIRQATPSHVGDDSWMPEAEASFRPSASSAPTSEAKKVLSTLDHSTATATGLSAVNDRFWQRFLTEAPGSHEALQSESCSERRITESIRSNPEPDSSYGRFWWNANYMVKHTYGIEHIATAERW